VRVTLAAFLLAGLAVLLIALPACEARRRGGQTQPPPDPRPPAPVRAVPAVEPSVDPAPQPRELPPITAEPTVRVLLAEGELLPVRLLQAARSEDGQLLPAGAYALRARGDAIVVVGQATRLPGDEHRLGFASAFRRACFALPDGAGGRRPYAGELIVRMTADGGSVQLIESLPISLYLRGVLAKEVEPDWPLEALKAQAVAARSYACAQWSQRHEQPVHLDASEQVDMAYAGFIAEPHLRLATALAQTRGDLLWYHEQPLLAFFHAASGGHTESPATVWPDRRCPDGVTPLGPAMPARHDRWHRDAVALAPQRLGPWEARIRLGELARRLRESGRHDVSRPFAVNVIEQDDDSLRARRLRIRHEAGELELSAHSLRMLMGSTTVRSTLWFTCHVQGDELVIRGDGYGHGVGLAQASAWAMARAGRLAPDILLQFYPGATLRRMW